VKELAEARDLWNKLRVKQFAPSMKKMKTKNPFWWKQGKEVEIDVPDGIIAPLTREYGGNVHDRRVVEITSGSFKEETHGANPHSAAYYNNPYFAAKNAADLETDSFLCTADGRDEDIPHTRNNWVCYDFKERRIVPTHYTIRTNANDPGGFHLKWWLVDTSVDGKSGGRSPAKRTTSSSTAGILLARLRLQAAGSAASSG
jgi:hypothetical protein